MTGSGLGQWGESRATSFLEDRGWTIEDRNFSTPLGECDILAWDGDTLVFVEVKTRSDARFGPPEEAVTRNKRDHLRRVARLALAELDRDVNCRFDVIAVEMDGTDSEVRHIENAFEATE